MSWKRTCNRGSDSASSGVLNRNRARLVRASSYRPCRTNSRGDGGRKKHPRARMIPGIIWIPSGIRHDIELGTKKQTIRCYYNQSKKLNILDRVMKPVQNPNTTPSTMESCSRAISEPRTSGGLISAIYRGESILVYCFV